MALTDSYVQTYGQLPEVFKRIGAGQAPDKFTRQHLKDLGFATTGFHAVIPLLKSLGFLSPDGSPTQRYHDYRDGSRSRAVMGEALKEAYGDLFTIKAQPTAADKTLIEGKFKSAHNAGDRSAQLMTSTFLALLALADLQAKPAEPPAPAEAASEAQASDNQQQASRQRVAVTNPTLHYNIQIHLPATKDVEVFNAIFKSLREHLLD
jgi:uncharacterized protein DUF5343